MPTSINRWRFLFFSISSSSSSSTWTFIFCVLSFRGQRAVGPLDNCICRGNESAAGRGSFFSFQMAARPVAAAGPKSALLNSLACFNKQISELTGENRVIIFADNPLQQRTDLFSSFDLSSLARCLFLACPCSRSSG